MVAGLPAAAAGVCPPFVADRPAGAEHVLSGCLGGPPAGYGKTTLLAQWAERNGQAFAWVSVDEADNDPKVLLTYVTGLARSNLLLVPLDRRGVRYRYHHLFRDMLLAERERLEPGMMAVPRRRAAAWCLANGRPEEALEYSMAAGDVDQAARLVQSLHLGDVANHPIGDDAIRAAWRSKEK